MNVLEQVHAWAKALQEKGLISRALLEELNLTENPSAAKLFEDRRPLVVAFFGGTGVGKSTLLNRLAGEKIAQTGIERPTSREVTFYLHTLLKPEKLPPGIPNDKVKLVFHRSAKFKEIVWVDLPDIDSLEHANRELTLSLLPYFDVLIYVVSPERYKDKLGFEVLRERKKESLFLFVMNRWDEAQEPQIEDFTQELKQAGFFNPIVLRCDSRSEIAARKPDDFGKLVELLEDFVRSHGIEALSARNTQKEINKAEGALNRLLESLDGKRIDCLIARWRTLWKDTQEAIRPGLKGSAVVLAREIGSSGARTFPLRERGASPSLKQDLAFDSWTETFLLDALDRLNLEAQDLGVPVEPVQEALSSIKPRLHKKLFDEVQRNMRCALAAPGSWLRRFLVWCFRHLRYLLPLAVSFWAGYRLVLGFYFKTYLGIDFAVHSLLLLGCAFVIPQLFYRLLEPSLEKAAYRGIQQGLALGLESIALEVERKLSEIKSELLKAQSEGKHLIEQVTNYRLQLTAEVGAFSQTPILHRMLA